MSDEVAELGERVASHAGNRCAALRVFVHEIVDYVSAKTILEIENVVGNAELGGHGSGVLNGIQRAARAVRDRVTVAKQLHRGTDDIVPRFHQQRRRYRRVDAA